LREIASLRRQLEEERAEGKRMTILNPPYAEKRPRRPFESIDSWGRALDEWKSGIKL
jgi:hypothetical protein